MVVTRRAIAGAVALLGVLLSPGHLLAAEEAAAAQREPAEPRRAIERHLEQGLALLEQGDYAGAQEQFAAILQLDPTHRDALRLMTKAQRALNTARAREARERRRLRDEAERLAISFAKEKADAQAASQAKAEAQLARAREQQLKYLYTRGQNLSRKGAYQAAIDTLHQMVLLDPAHPLVRAAQQLITRAETKLAEARARASVKAWPTQGPAIVSDLEQQLAAKRIELATIFQYAQVAMKERNYEMAIELAQRVLAQDPRHAEALQLVEKAQTARLAEEEAKLTRWVELDERQMINEVLEAQRLPESRRVRLAAPAVARAAQEAMAKKLQVPITLQFDDVALGDVLEFIADAASVSIIPSPNLDLDGARVSLKVTDLPIEMAIKYLAKSQSLAYRIEQDAVLIASPDEFANEPLETRVFFLRSGLGPFALEEAALEANTTFTMEPLKTLIERVVPQPPDGRLVVDERSGALIATNTAENLMLMEELIRQLDIAPAQVLIEARFVELTETDLDQLGLESVLTGGYAIGKKGDVDETEGPAHQLTTGSGLTFPALSREDEGLNLTVEGVLTGLQFETVLHQLAETSKSKTLSAPRVTTLNNQTALIRVVDEFRYPTRYEVSLVQFDINGDGDFDDAGETEFVNVPQDFQKRDIGILMSVTPSVGKDHTSMTLVLAPEVSQFSQFRNLGGGVTVPEFTSSQLTTSVSIDSGQTVVLGGLMKDTTSETVTKVPWLGDLPVVGSLFRQAKETSTRKSLLIFITAWVLTSEGQLT